MTSYGKTSMFKIAVDKKSTDELKKFSSAFNDAVDKVSKMSGSTENIKALKQLQKDQKLIQKKLGMTAGEALEAKQRMKKQVFDVFVNGMKTAATNVANFFVSTVTGAIEQLRDIASFNLGTSSTYSSEAWDMLKDYGVTGSQAFALKKAMEDINVNSYDQLTEALLQPQVANRFAERIGYWNENYSDAMETGKAFNDFMLEWKDFKNELTMDFVDWFAANKDSIKTVIKFGIVVLEGLAKVIGNIINFFTGTDSNIPTASEIAKGYVVSNTTNNNNQSVNINVNGSNGTAIGQQAYTYLQSMKAVK